MKILCAWALTGAALVATGSANATNCNNADFKKLQFFSSDTGAILWQGPREDSPRDPNDQRLLVHVLLQSGDDWAGAFSNCTGIEGKPLNQVRNLSFDFVNPASEPVQWGGGSPRYSVGIDTSGDMTPEFYAFLEAFYCEDPLSGNPRWSTADFTGRTEAGCTIWAENAPYSSDGIVSAWGALTAAYPGAKVTDAFFVVDWTGTSIVDRLSFHSKSYLRPGTNSAAIKNCPNEASC
jgi:hypothetical protein